MDIFTLTLVAVVFLTMLKLVRKAFKPAPATSFKYRCFPLPSQRGSRNLRRGHHPYRFCSGN